MALTKEFFERETNIKAKVLADSVNTQTGQRMVTFEIEYPRFILAELNTHKMLEKNSSSSRAIPIKAMIEQIFKNTAMPVYWGTAKAGMQAGEEVCEDDEWWYEEKWLFALDEVTYRVKQMSSLVEGKEGFMTPLHKQIPNRLLEPFQMMKTVITGTDWDNFFNLRLHPTAQPEICMLAYKMYEAMQASQPFPLYKDEWHLPYVNRKRGKVSCAVEYTTQEGKAIDLETAIQISSSCCAQTSYRKSDDSVEKAKKVFDMLINADVVHASPFGHLGTPIIKYDFINVNLTDTNTWQEGITHMRKDGTLCSGNLAGFISYRHLVPNNTCYDFDYEERMKLFE